MEVPVLKTGKPRAELMLVRGGITYPYEIWEKNGNIFIEIEWGDWKHDHRNADYIMETAFGYKVENETVTEEDGSDTYSAVHTYVSA